MGKERVHYLDVAKGLLILALLFSHAVWQMGGYGFAGCDVMQIGVEARKFWSPFFMPAFFTITGLCSNFNSPAADFIWKNVRTLVLPSIIFALLVGVKSTISMYPDYIVNVWDVLLKLGDFWFLLSLFIAKIVYFYLRKADAKFFTEAACAAIYIFGVWCHLSGVKNLYYFQQAALFLPFLHMGVLLKNRTNILDKFAPLAIIYAAVFAASTLARWKFQCASPTVHSAIEISSWLQAAVYFAMALSGILFALSLAKKISSSAVLEHCGRHTLFIYCLHIGFVMSPLIRVYKHFFPVSEIGAFALFFALIALSALFCILAAVLYNRTALSRYLGKF